LSVGQTGIFPRLLVPISKKIAQSFISSKQSVAHTNGSHNEAAPEWLCCRTQGAFFTWFRAGSLLHPPAHCCASVF